MILTEIITTLLQSIILVVIPKYFIDKKNNIEFKTGMIVFTLFILNILITSILGNSSLGAIIIHCVIIGVVVIGLKEERLAATVGASFIYLCIVTNMLIGSNLLFGPIQRILPEGDYSVIFTCILYGMQILMAILMLCNKEILFKCYTLIRKKNYSVISLITITVIVDFILFLSAIVHEFDDPIFKEVIFILLGILLIGVTIYFANIEKKSKEITRINNELQCKINELKKVKHDFGAQISYLYGLHLMGRQERLAELLKEMIDGQSNINSEVEIVNDCESIIAMIVNSVEHDGINIIIDEQAALSESGISEINIQRVISNILRNAVTAMCGEGKIKIETYDLDDDIYILIENNGPKIEEEIINKIFKIGFTTKKEDSDNHGMGLSIVKEIVEDNGGDISVVSTEENTKFIIKLPAD